MHTKGLTPAQVASYGMSQQVGNLAFPSPQSDEPAFDKPYSEATAQLIDTEARALVDAAFRRTMELLQAKREQVSGGAS